MIDTFSLLLSHGLLALAAWRLIQRPDLDEDGVGAKPRRGFGRPDQDAPGA